MKGVKLLLAALKVFIKTITESFQLKPTMQTINDGESYTQKVAKALLNIALETQKLLTPLAEKSLVGSLFHSVTNLGDVKKSIQIINQNLAYMGGAFTTLAVVNQQTKVIAQALITLLQSINTPDATKGIPDIFLKLAFSFGDEREEDKQTKMSPTDRLLRDLGLMIAIIQENIVKFDKVAANAIAYQELSQKKEEIIANSKKKWVTPTIKQMHTVAEELKKLIAEMETCPLGQQFIDIGVTQFTSLSDATITTAKTGIAGINTTIFALNTYNLSDNFTYYLLDENAGVISEHTAKFKKETENSLRSQIKSLNFIISQDIAQLSICHNFMCTIIENTNPFTLENFVTQSHSEKIQLLMKHLTNISQLAIPELKITSLIPDYKKSCKYIKKHAIFNLKSILRTELCKQAIAIITTSSTTTTSKANDSPISQPVKPSAITLWLTNYLNGLTNSDKDWEKTLLFLQQNITAMNQSMNPLSQALEKILVEMLIIDGKLSSEEYIAATTKRLDTSTTADPVILLLQTQTQQDLTILKSNTPEGQRSLETMQKLHQYILKQIKIADYNETDLQTNAKIAYAAQCITALFEKDNHKLPQWTDNTQAIPTELAQIITEHEQPLPTVVPTSAK